MEILFAIIFTLVCLTSLYIFLIAPRMFRKPDTKIFNQCFYAHRGLFDNSLDAPENSIKAFELAIKHNYGIELDVQLTKDNVPVVFHDATLQRMCNTKGCICHYTLSELKQLKLNNSAQTIPTLKEALAVIDGKVPIIIEFKPYDIPSKLCSKVWSILTGYKGAYCMESFHPLVLRWFKKNQPHVIRGQLCMEYWRESEYKGQVLYLLLSFLITNFLARPDFIAYKHNHAGNISRKLCSKLGAISACWTIQSPEDYHEAKKHFDIFIFDSFRL